MKNEIFQANPKLDCYFKTSDGECFFTENAAKDHARSLTEKTVETLHRFDYVEPNEEVVKPSEPVAPEMKIVSDDTQNASEPVEPTATTEPIVDSKEDSQKTESVEPTATTETVATTEKVEAKATTPVAEAVKPNTKK